MCFLDADSERFSAHFATGLLGPLVCEPDVSFVKAVLPPAADGAGAGPHDGAAEAEGGGRVNHLTARPALALFYPQLAQIRQPLAGEVAARRELLERLPFATGYGVEIAMLIDVWREVGPGGDRAGRSGGAPQPPPAAVGAHADGADGAGHDRPAAGAGGRLTAPPGASANALDGVAEHAPLERPPLASLADDRSIGLRGSRA